MFKEMNKTVNDFMEVIDKIITTTSKTKIDHE